MRLSPHPVHCKDDRATFEALCTRLNADNYHVLTALNSVELLKQIDGDILLVDSDVVLPEMEGADVLSRNIVRTNDYLAIRPITQLRIIITAIMPKIIC